MPLPAIYTTAFDLAQPSGGKITVLALNKILAVSGLSPATVDKVCISDLLLLFPLSTFPFVMPPFHFTADPFFAKPRGLRIGDDG